MDCTPSGSSGHGISQGKNTGVGCHFLLKEIFPTQGSNPGVLEAPALAGRFFAASATCRRCAKYSTGLTCCNVYQEALDSRVSSFFGGESKGQKGYKPVPVLLLVSGRTVESSTWWSTARVPHQNAFDS